MGKLHFSPTNYQSTTFEILHPLAINFRYFASSKFYTKMMIMLLTYFVYIQDIVVNSIGMN